jgi:phage FluMu protein Com
MIRFLCKTCRQKIKIEDKYADRSIQCPRCESVNRASERLSLKAPSSTSSSVSSDNPSDTVILHKFRCPSCYQKIRINVKYADQKVRCPRCKNVDTVPRSSHTETPIPTRSVATKNVSIVNFTTPRMRYYGNDPEDSLENELLLSIEPVSDPAPIPDEPVPACESTPARVTTPVPKATSISKSVVDGSLTDSDASHKPVTEPPVPPGLSQQENNAYSDFIVPKRAKSRFKSLFFIPICLGILLGSIVMYRYWQNHNYQPESWVSNTAGYEKKSTKSYSYKIPEEEGKTQNVIHPASQRTRAKQLAYLNSLAEFARVVTDLDHGIEKGMALSEFITKAIHLSKAYHKIKVSPEIQRILDFDLSRRAKQYTPGAEEMAPILRAYPNNPEQRNVMMAQTR